MSCRLSESRHYDLTTNRLLQTGFANAPHQTSPTKPRFQIHTPLEMTIYPLDQTPIQHNITNLVKKKPHKPQQPTTAQSLFHNYFRTKTQQSPVTYNFESLSSPTSCSVPCLCVHSWSWFGGCRWQYSLVRLSSYKDTQSRCKLSNVNEYFILI